MDVERQLRIVRLAKLYPVVMDVACMAVPNLYRRLRGNGHAEETTAIVHLSRQSGDIAILPGDGELYPRTFFSRCAKWDDAMDYLTNNIRDELMYHRFKRRGKPVEKVVLTGQIPTGPCDPNAEDSDRETESRGSGPPEASTGADGDFAARLGKAAGVAVSIWDPLSDMTVARAAARKIGERRSPVGSLAVSLGLALRRN
jgi:hypothetical protein